MTVRPETIDLYLLGELGPEEAAEFEGRAQRDAGLATSLERGSALVSRLGGMGGDAWTPVRPPPLAIDLADGQEPAVRTKWWKPSGRIALSPAIALACSVGLIAIGAGAAVIVQGIGGSNDGGASVGLASLGGLDAGASGTVALSDDGSTATVSVSGLAETPKGSYYEMWLMNSDRDLVSAGGFRVGADGRATVRVAMPANMADYRYFDISLEDTAGAPGHSGKSVMRSPPRSVT